MDSVTIVTLAGKCATAFQEHLSAIQHNGSSETGIRSQAVETQNARFNLWADNLGVFAGGRASLDARLRNHGDIAMMITGQLDLMLLHLERLSTYESVERDYEVMAAIEHGCDDDDSTSSALSVASFSTSSTGTSEHKRNDTKSVGNAAVYESSPFVDVADALHRLHRVAMAIRESGVSSHDLKASVEQFYDEDNRDIVDVFRKWCLEVLHHKFEAANDNILNRIAYVNAERRRLFLYRKKHQSKLTSRVQHPTKENAALTTVSDLQRHCRPSPEIENSSEVKINKGQHTSGKGSAARLSQTTASKMVRTSYHYQASAQPTLLSIGPSTQIPLDFSLYPPAPKVSAGAAEFYCPYCCRVHDALERSSRHWKQHFLKDLAPFVCLVDACTTPYKTYSDQQTWLKHMEAHNIKYTCQRHEEPIKFDNEESFNRHILVEHQRLAPSRLASLRSINGSSSRLDIDACLLCGFRPSSLALGQPSSRHQQAYKELTNHIAEELHYVAMWSLVDGNVVDLDNNGKSSDIKTVDEDSHSEALTFSSVGHEVKASSMDEWQDEFHSHVLLEHGMHRLEGSNLEEEWSSVFRVKSPYGGHDQDPKLESFVRRLKLEKLLAEDRLANPQLPCHYIPFKPSRDFYGRKSELQRLEVALNPSRATENLRIMTLIGPAGIGKTQLAAQYSQQFQSQYDVVLLVRADEESKLAKDFVEIGIQLGFIGRDLPESRDQEHCRQFVKAWLANPLKAPADTTSSELASWLLIFDHIIDPDVVKDYWPTDCKSGSIIMTSRKAMPWSTTYVPMLTVEPFHPADSAAFLSRLLKLQGNENMKLGSRAFHSPTQLLFLARMITHQRYSLDSFIQASQENGGKKAIMVLHTEDATTNQTDFSEWALESLSSTAAALLDVMAMLDADSITDRVLTMPPGNISVAAYPRTMEEYSEARTELSSFSFIFRGRSNGNLNIHRLIQDAARKNMSEKSFRDTFHTCIDLISNRWPYQEFTWRHGVRRWVTCEELYPHLVRLHHFSKRMNILEDSIDNTYELAKLATDVAWYCHERGRLTESEGFCETALKICTVLRQALDVNQNLSKTVTVAQIDRTTGEVHHNHGCISAEINKPKKALEHQLIFNRMMLEELGAGPGADMRLGMSFNELGVAYMINDDYAKGEECFERSVAEMKRVDNFKPYKISLPLVNLAYCRCLASNYVEAEAILLQGLADRVGEFGENDRESFITGRFYHGLANAKLGQGLEQESFEYLEKARDHYKMTLGRGHHRSADVMVALGRHYNRIHDNKNAAEIFGKALDVYGDRSVYAPEKARAFFQRAKSLRILGLATEAQQDEDACFALYQEIRPSDKRSLHELSDHDFDKIIVFWSR